MLTALPVTYNQKVYVHFSTMKLTHRFKVAVYKASIIYGAKMLIVKVVSLFLVHMLQTN